jgi:hypothetical protein
MIPHCLIETFGYVPAMIIKNITILLGGTFIGLCVGKFIIAWAVRDEVVLDKEMDGVKIIRIRANDKVKYVANLKTVSDVVHALLILLGWRLGIIRKNSIYFENARGSRFVVRLLFGITIVFIILGILMSFIIVENPAYQ